ncbi:MAG: N-acetyltransferase [Chitinophagaceae bacterium]|nr:N-acetyltransferase [Chitinophagaceae bacterium]
MLSYRNATITDLPKIIEIYNSIVAGRMVTADTEPVSVESRIKWFHEHEPVNRPLWMVYDSDNLVGWVSFQSFYGRPAYRFTAEISIYLDQQMRGKGYGEKILKYAMSKCAELEIKTLLGYIFGHNEPSLKLFKKLGFETWGTFPGIAELDNIERDLIILGKRIN